MLLVQAGSPLAERGTPPKLAEIAHLPLIGARQCRSLQQVETHFQARGLTPRVVFHSDDNGTIQGLVGAGVGVALIPRLAALPETDDTVIVELDPRIPPRLIAIAWHRDRHRSPAARAFVETAVAFCAEIAEQQTAEARAGRTAPAHAG